MFICGYFFLERPSKRESGHGTEAADSFGPRGRVRLRPDGSRSVQEYHPARTADYRLPRSVSTSALADSGQAPPRTVTDPRPETEEWQLSLDEAIRIALENAKVIRILAGTTAVSSGQTIYDAAITNTTIDQAQAAFDPIAHWNNTWSRTNTPTAEFNPTNPLLSFITSTPIDSYATDGGLTKTNVIGGQWSVDATATDTRFATSSCAVFR